MTNETPNIIAKPTKNNANPRLIRLIYACPNPQITIVKIVAIIFRFPISVTNAHSDLGSFFPYSGGFPHNQLDMFLNCFPYREIAMKKTIFVGLFIGLLTTIAMVGRTNSADKRENTFAMGSFSI
jgi:hypothetical protein